MDRKSGLNFPYPTPSWILEPGIMNFALSVLHSMAQARPPRSGGQEAG